MDSTSIELAGSKITAIETDGDTVKIRFEPAYLVKTMTGSVERTRWWQNGWLVFGGARLEDPGVAAALPAECDGGDVVDNVYTYRDMLPVPLDSRGRAACRLRLRDTDAEVVIEEADAVRLEMEDVARYIEHIRPD